MKKVVRTVWISLLSGLAFLVACTCQNKLTRAEKKQLKQERAVIMEQIEAAKQDAIVFSEAEKVMAAKQNELAYRSRLGEINTLLGDKQAILDNDNEIGKINHEIDSLKQVIQASIPPCVYGPPTSDPTYQEYMMKHRRNDLMDQLEQLEKAIKRREGACVYGSPEVIQRYGEETRRLRSEAESIRQQIEEIDKELNKDLQDE
jgi:hypothetical protein